MNSVGVTAVKQLNVFINEHRGPLVDAIVDRLYALNPQMQQRYGKLGREKCLEDTNYHLVFLSEAIAANRPELFADYVAWAKTLLAGFNVPAEDLASNLQIIGSVVSEEAPENTQATLNKFMDSGLSQLSGGAAPALTDFRNADIYAELAQQYLQALLESNRYRASQLILDAVKAGVSIKDLYLHVFQQAQYEIGRLWHINKITIAHEHYCTAATQMIMSQLYPYISTGEKNGRWVIATSVSGELHELGARMVADFFEMDGWNTMFLGANTPQRSIVQAVIERKADVLAISATMSFHVSRVTALIEAVRAAPECAHVKIIVGGCPFNISPTLWEQVGADGDGRTAQDAIELAERLFSGTDAAT